MRNFNVKSIYFGKHHYTALFNKSLSRATNTNNKKLYYTTNNIYYLALIHPIHLNNYKYINLKHINPKTMIQYTFFKHFFFIKFFI